MYSELSDSLGSLFRQKTFVLYMHIDQIFSGSMRFPKTTVHGPCAYVSSWKTLFCPRYVDLFHIKLIGFKQTPNEQKNLSPLTTEMCWKFL